jgi:hypothetical protein
MNSSYFGAIQNYECFHPGTRPGISSSLGISEGVSLNMAGDISTEICEMHINKIWGEI